MVSRQFSIERAPDGARSIRIHARGIDVLDNPQINRGTAFTVEERNHLGLTGMLPSTVESLEQQVG